MELVLRRCSAEAVADRGWVNKETERTGSMRRLKKFFALGLAALMMTAGAFTCLAAGTGSITVKPDRNSTEDSKHTYGIYKVFDGNGDGKGNMAFRLVDGKTEAPEGFSVDSAGNVTYTGKGTDGELTKEDIDALREYVAGDTAVATGSSAGKESAVAEGLENGYYFISSTYGAAVMLTNANPDATVGDKNKAPEMKKTIAGGMENMDEAGKNALAQIGTKVSYQAEITTGNGMEGYVYHDHMENLDFNNDVVVKVDDKEVDASNYTVKSGAEAAEGDTFTVEFKKEFIDSLEQETVILILYSANVATTATKLDPANNTAYLEYSDPHDTYATPKETTRVYTASFTIIKYGVDNTQAETAAEGRTEKAEETPLQGAGFVISRETDGKQQYYKLADGAVTWVDKPEDADEHISDEDGSVQTFSGLEDGKYTVTETTVPRGYKKMADYNFTIEVKDYENDEYEIEAKFVNEKGARLPASGGAGTTMYYMTGLLAVAGAVMLLMMKRRTEVR